MRQLMLFAFMIATSCIAQGGAIDDSTAAHLLASSQLHDYGELELPAENKEPLLSWAKERGTHGFDSLMDQAGLGNKALALFDITATDAEFFEISLIALGKYSRGYLPDSYLSAVLMPTERKRGLLAINYRNERLREVSDLCLKRLPPNSSLANLINLTLSGDQAKSVVKHAGDGVYPERYGPWAKQALEGKVPSLSDVGGEHPTSGLPRVPQVEPKPSPSSVLSEEAASSTPWSIIVVLIVAALGLLWVLVKKRK